MLVWWSARAADVSRVQKCANCASALWGIFYRVHYVLVQPTDSHACVMKCTCCWCQQGSKTCKLCKCALGHFLLRALCAPTFPTLHTDAHPHGSLGLYAKPTTCSSLGLYATPAHVHLFIHVLLHSLGSRTKPVLFLAPPSAFAPWGATGIWEYNRGVHWGNTGDRATGGQREVGISGCIGGAGRSIWGTRAGAGARHHHHHHHHYD